jgi:hypothetical protein
VASEIYDVTLTDTNTGQQTTVVGTASTTSLIVTVPASFYATVSTPGQPDPVTIHISIPQVFTSGQNGTFQINPPLAAGGPVFVSAVNSAVAWRLFSGGTAPYEDEFNNGSVPNGMPNLPPSAIWPGKPNRSFPVQRDPDRLMGQRNPRKSGSLHLAFAASHERQSDFGGGRIRHGRAHP